MAIQSYLRDNFRYTLDPPAIEPEDPVGSFLFRSKPGTASILPPPWR